MIKRTMIYLICCLWLMLFTYFIFKQENVEENYIQNTVYNHNALSGNSIGILQTKKTFQSQSAHANISVGNNTIYPKYNGIKYNINHKPIYESNKNYRSNTNYMATTAKLSNTKHKSEAAATIAPLAYTNFALLVQTNYAHYSERKPFDNEQASFGTGPQRAPFSDDPAFPSDPGDMGAPIGAGNWALVMLGAIYALYKYILNLKK